MKTLLFAILLIIASPLGASEVPEEYEDIVRKYAEATFSEFMFHNPDIFAEGRKFLSALAGNGVTIVAGLDKIERKVFVVLHPSESGSLYVSMIQNKDGMLEVMGRGSIPVTPEAFESKFDAHLHLVIFYPGDV